MTVDGESAVATGMESIIAGVADVVSLMPEVFSVITGNELLTFFLAVSVLGVGFSVFRNARRTAR